MGKRKSSAPARLIPRSNTGQISKRLKSSTPKIDPPPAAAEQWRTILSPELDASLDRLVGEIQLSESCGEVDSLVRELRLCYLDRSASNRFGSPSVGKLAVEVLGLNRGVVVGNLDAGESFLTSLVILVKKQLAGMSYSDKKLRVFFTEKLFVECEGDPGHACRTHIKNLIVWLRPELSLDFFYGPVKNRKSNFDASRFYDALKRKRDEYLNEACLELNFEGLIPQLRPYQQQAVHWMVQRETGAGDGNKEHPLWVKVDALDNQGFFYYNTFDGMVSREPRNFCTYVRGGILADEMGIGKTVETLACILANKYTGVTHLDSASQTLQLRLNQRRAERIECVCGNNFSCGVMVQCDYCEAWQHTGCVGFSPPRKKKRRKSGGKVQEDDETIFVCSSCAEVLAGVEVQGQSGATLIVCPTPIMKQWEEEITRHIEPGSLKALVYHGVNQGCSTLGDENPKPKRVGALDFASADLVITTYDILRGDLFHDEEAHQRNMRFEKRYQVIATPLTKLCWWRVCLDEAQMVECNTAQATEMAMRLNAQNLWCVTGTPVQKGLHDLYGLLRFLKAEPFDNHSRWKQAINQPYEEGRDGGISFTHKFFREIMWRSMKQDVLDQLNIPSQDERVTWLKFSRIESHFYKQQHQQCVSKAREVISKLSLGDRPLTHVEATKLMNPLLRLRQACCHPQVGRSGIRSLQEKPMSMDEILQVMIDKAKVEGEESQRVLFGALNGLGALAVMEDDIKLAVSIYREILATAEENSSSFKMDTLQRIHTLYYLAEALEKGGSLGLPRTLRDSSLLSEYKELRLKYMSEHHAKLADEQQEFYAANKKVAEVRNDISPNWWLEALSLLENSRSKDFNISDFINKVVDALGSKNAAHNASSLALRFKEVSGLKFLLQQELDAIDKKREVLLKSLVELDKSMLNPSAYDIQRAGQCPSCQHDEKPSNRICAHCEMDVLFQAYENRLFFLTSISTKRHGIVTPEEALRARLRVREQKGRSLQIRNGGVLAASSVQVLNRPSETEHILSMLLAYVKEEFDDEGIEAAKKHLEYMEALRVEYPAARGLAAAQQPVLQALDELNMAISRLHLLSSDDQEDSTRLGLQKDDIPRRNVELTAEKFRALDAVNKAKGQYKYLKGLAQSRLKPATGAEPGISEDVCPICHDKLGPELIILPCGHMLCCRCMELMSTRKKTEDFRLKRISCPTCRERTFVSNAAHVNPNAEIPEEEPQQNDEESSIEVQGSYGTKIEAVVRRILKLRADDPFVKILVFSSWKEVLDVIQHSLLANKVTMARTSGRRNWNSSIARFKQENVQVLLLPVQHGANGLNLVEAQHVVLVEPLLNPATEAQAINRVHRIGQTSRTLVHRFIIQDTVEDNIYKFSQQKASSSSLPMKQKELALSTSDMNKLLGCDDQNRGKEACREGETQVVENENEASSSSSSSFAGDGCELQTHNNNDNSLNIL